MAKFDTLTVPEVLARMPSRVQAFIADAQAIGIDARDGEKCDEYGNPLVSLHGSLAQFAQLAAMAKIRIPKRKGLWWMSCGIVGTLYRVTDNELLGVIEKVGWVGDRPEHPYPRPTPENARKAAAEEAARRKEANETEDERRARLTDQYMRNDPAGYLRDMPNTAAEFRRKLIEDARRDVWFLVERRVKASLLHGYTLSAESGDAIKLSLDSIVEAIMAAEINHDQKRHTAIIHKLRTYMVDAGKGAPLQVARVTIPNASLLTGEQQ